MSVTLQSHNTQYNCKVTVTQQKHWESQNPFSIQQTSQTSQTTRTSI